MKRRRVERLDWRKCWVEIEKEVKIHCSGWELCDEDVDNWLLWMRLQPRVTIHELDFSNNSLTSVALGRMCEFLDGCGTHCEQWCFSGNKICDDGFRQLSEHIARGRPAQSVRFDSNPISLHGLIWFLATISLHPQYPAEHQVWGGQRRFRPLWVSLRNTNVVQDKFENASHIGSKPMVPFWGRCPPILVYFRWDWDVHWGYGLLTHGHIGCGPISPDDFRVLTVLFNVAHVLVGDFCMRCWHEGFHVLVTMSWHTVLFSACPCYFRC